MPKVEIDSLKLGKKDSKGSGVIRKKKNSRARRRNQRKKSKSRIKYLESRNQKHLKLHCAVPASVKTEKPNLAVMESSSQNQPAPGHSFWANYKSAMEWQSKHFVNYWKSRCSALELENEHLYRTLETFAKQGNPPNNSKEPEEDAHVPEEQDGEHNEAPADAEKENNDEREERLEDCSDDDDEDNFTFEFDEGMLEFLETSVKHKIELKKKRDAEAELEAAEELANATEKLKLPREIMAERRTEMNKLYGAHSAPMILGMETAMQLTFDRFNDQHQPKHWPNIPLNL